MGKHDLALVLRVEFLKLVVEVLDDTLGGVVNAEVGDEADRELALDGGGDDSLRAGSVEGTLNTVDRERRVTHATHELLSASGRDLTHSLDSVVAKGDLGTNSGVNVGHLEVNLLKLVLLVLGDRGNELLDTGDENLAIWRNKLGHWDELIRHSTH